MCNPRDNRKSAGLETIDKNRQIKVGVIGMESQPEVLRSTIEHKLKVSDRVKCFHKVNVKSSMQWTHGHSRTSLEKSGVAEVRDDTFSYN